MFGGGATKLTFQLFIGSMVALCEREELLLEQQVAECIWGGIHKMVFSLSSSFILGALFSKTEKIRGKKRALLQS